MNTAELLAKLKSEGWSLEPDRIYPSNCITFNRMGDKLVQELIQSGILREVKGCQGEWEVSPMTLLIGKHDNSVCPTDSGRWIPDLQARTKWLERRAA